MSGAERSVPLKVVKKSTLNDKDKPDEVTPANLGIEPYMHYKHSYITNSI